VMVRKNQVSYNSRGLAKCFDLGIMIDLVFLPFQFNLLVQNYSCLNVLIVIQFNPHSNRLYCTTLLELILVSVEKSTRSVTSPEGNAYPSKVSLQHVATFYKHIAIMPLCPVY